MITGVHTVLFTPDPERVREFLSDVLGFRSVDAGGGWLIFALPPSEIAAHPADEPGAPELYLMCDDVATTVAELQARDVQIAGPIRDEGWGRVTSISLPGGGEIGLYEPRHARP
ncbi:MAG TPA: VOC family protein [Thermoleophilaceae bacterium]|jgi:catechol 2,3-dioxygenase-like lactoylglutathione lyase family enzyme